MVADQDVRPAPRPVRLHGPQPGGLLLALLLAGTGALALFAALAFYVQQFCGYASPEAWTLLLVLPAGIAVGSTQVSARLLHRAAPRVLIAAGLVLAAAGLLLLTGEDGSLPRAGRCPAWSSPASAWAWPGFRSSPP